MERSVCNRNCWILGAIAGIVVLLFTSGIGDLGFAAGLFLGLLTFGMVGAMLVWLVCNDRPELFHDDGGVTGLDWKRELADSQPEAMMVPASVVAEPQVSSNQMPIVAGAMPAGRSVVAETKVAKAAPEVAKAAPKAKPASGKAKAKPAAKKVELPADDLRRINGVGPKLSDWLHENGVTRFEQIAAWDGEAVADFAHRLGRMGGRIEADDWVGQARLLASGGETEHSRAVDRGEST
ncbi:hypothetical protein [Paracoccus aestuariivivens]|uniref:Endonuclease n=1 Tax=Paracoccus aestuariivivens TaxID=1820333 RepID=A0A6L6J2B7_9RHOB|nr:hypothetical protein [Paracoccus aestuariivivens]MTH76263.1 hypothetical protein [Paracoccus aestuariivivens]